MSNTSLIWIDISKIKDYNLQGIDILIWQHNLVDEESSRFQRASYWEDFCFTVYPITHRTRFRLNKEGFYEGNDSEGDLCRVTHFALITPPKEN